MKTLRSLLVALLVLTLAGTALAAPAVASHRTPVVIFPAYHFNILEFWVLGQEKFPECPSWGRFEVYFLNPEPSQRFSQECQDKLMTLIVDPDSSKPMARRFRNQDRVFALLKHYGRTESAPFYEPLYAFLESNGWARNQNIRVAAYDARLTPDIGYFLELTQALIEDTYNKNGKRPVHLIGHSNGPLYTQYLLTHMTQAWKDKYIHGFTPLAGNWAGQGLFYTVLFTGLNITDFHFPTDPTGAALSAARYATQPSTYMSLPDPDVFGSAEVVIQDASTDTAYTPLHYQQLFEDAGIALAEELAPYYVGFVAIEPPAYPNVDVYAEKGSGLDTLVGLELPDLTVGHVFTGGEELFFRDGDGNQEDITNDAIASWAGMPCHHFELNDNVDIDHFSLASDPDVLQRLLQHLGQPKSVCP